MISRGATFHGTPISLQYDSDDKEIVYERCYFYGCSVIGLHTWPRLNRVHFEQCTFYGSYDEALVKVQPYTLRLHQPAASYTIQGCEFHNSHRHAVAVGHSTHQQQHIRVSDNLIDTVTSDVPIDKEGEVHGIIALGRYVWIERNVILDVLSHGRGDCEAIYTKSVQGQISENVIQGSGIGAGAITCKGWIDPDPANPPGYEGHHNIVSGNIISGVRGNGGHLDKGIYVSAPHSLVHSNLLEGCGMTIAGRDQRVTDNHIVAPTGVPVYLRIEGSGSTTTFQRNTVDRPSPEVTYGVGYRGYGSGRVVVSDNVLDKGSDPGWVGIRELSSSTLDEAVLGHNTILG